MANPLFDTNPANQIWSVSALNDCVRAMLERNLPLLRIQGEIAEWQLIQRSGHAYFTLKDATARVRCAFFRNRLSLATWLPKIGDRVIVEASVTLYPARGDYQLVIQTIKPAGAGQLYEHYLQLKQSLTAAGWFDPAHKKNLPAHIRTVGIISSLHAAALKDVVAVIQRRAPDMALVLYATPVQGSQAAYAIAQAIERANAQALCDVLIICRGGGSIEDLWSFNERVVAEAMHAATLPIVSGVGHESDYTICDWLADIRAATPSAAAEIVTNSRVQHALQLNHSRDQLTRRLRTIVNNKWQILDDWRHKTHHPGTRLHAQKQTLKHWRRLSYLRIVQHVDRAQNQHNALQLRLKQHRPNCVVHRTQLHHLRQLGQSYLARRLSNAQERLTSWQKALDFANPQHLLDRGFSLVYNADGRLLRQATQSTPGDRLKVRLSQGSLQVEVKAVTPNTD